MPPRRVTAADAANAARLPLRTFRGLLASGWPLFDPPPRPAHGWRRYGRLDVIRTATVARLMRHGFTPSEATEVLALTIDRIFARCPAVNLRGRVLSAARDPVEATLYTPTFDAAVSIDLAAVADDATERMNAMRSPARNGDAARGRPAGAQPRESSAQPHNPRIAAL